MKQKITSHIWLPRQPHEWFLVVALLFGTLFSFITPPYKVPDEYGHMARAYGISEGQFVATVQNNDMAGGMIPNSLGEVGILSQYGFTLADLPTLMTIPLQPDVRSFAEYPNMVLYSPLVYAPQAIAFSVARVVQLPAIDAFYLARFFNVVAFALLLSVAIRLLPFGKWAGVVIGLLPMNLLLAGSMSGDPMTIGIVSILTALALRLITLDRALTTKEHVLLLGFVAVVVLIKLPYQLLLLLLLLVPASVIGGTRRRWLMWMGGVAVVAAAVGLGWLLLAKTALVSYGPEGVDTAAQIHYIFAHPLSFIKTLLYSFASPASDGFLSHFVVSIGYVTMTIPLWASFLYCVFLALALWPLRVHVALSRAQKIVVAILILACIGIIATLLYVSWTPVAKHIVDGMQARYLTPLLILLIPLLAIRATKNKRGEGLLPVAYYRWLPVGFLTLSLGMSAYYFYILGGSGF